MKMPLTSGAAAAVLALQLATPAVQSEAPTVQNEAPVVQIRGGWCSHGYDIDIYGRCYPNGVIPPQYQAARQGYGYGYGYPHRYYRRHYYY
jgi:hypothetical protein